MGDPSFQILRSCFWTITTTCFLCELEKNEVILEERGADRPPSATVRLSSRTRDSQGLDCATCRPLSEDSRTA